MVPVLDDLNPNQQKAINWEGSPLLVLAGPGSGKTRVLTMRIARLISESPGQRFRVLGLTFTTKAADEMRTRIDQMISDGRERVHLATFHSFAADIMRQHGSHLGFKPDFVILNQTADREAFLLAAIESCAKEGMDLDKRDVKLLPMLDRLLDTCTSEEEVRRRVRDPDLGDKLACLFTQYRLELTQANRLDFPCLLSFATQIVESIRGVARQLRVTYQHVCVDEFQDTNQAQYSFLRGIVGPTPKNLFVVADDDQIIYQWNGADPARLTELRTDYGMQVVQLPANYRCPPSVIELANNLIRHNMTRSPDKEPLQALKTGEATDAVRLEQFPTFEEELAWVGNDIASRGVPERGKCVILGRTKKLLEQAKNALCSMGVEAVLHVRKDEFQSTPFRWLHSVLRLANARGDREQLRRVCKAFFGIEGIDLRVEQVVASASVTGGDLLRAWFDEVLARSESLSDSGREFMSAGRALLVGKLDFISFVEHAKEWFELLKVETSDDPTRELFVDYDEDLAAWRDSAQGILDRLGHSDATLEAFLQEVDLSPKSPPPPPGAVRCFTIHSAKGMEFEHVYLIGLVEDQLPSFQAIKKGDQSRELQEERRNCFVAITRCQTSLTLTLAKRYWGWDKQPSRFLREMVEAD